MLNNFFLTFVLFILSLQPAFAYLDPGTGSAIMTIIIGFFVAIGVLFKTFWYKIKKFLGLSKSKNTDTK
jgi:O-antigen/teichoic acid export membrane protein